MVPIVAAIATMILYLFCSGHRHRCRGGGGEVVVVFGGRCWVCSSL